MMPSDEFLEKKHARFVIPEEAEKANQVQGMFVHDLDLKRENDPPAVEEKTPSSPPTHRSKNLSKL